MEPIIWLIILVILIVIEIITLGLSTIWFAGGALAAFIGALCNLSVPGQVILFLVVSVVLLLFTRPVAVRYLEKGKTLTNVDSLIGAEAVVTEDIENLKGKGQAYINGLEWTARTKDSDIMIKKDSVVRVVRVEGVKLIVEEKENQ